MFQVVEPTDFMENKRVLICAYILYRALSVTVSSVVSMNIGNENIP